MKNNLILGLSTILAVSACSSTKTATPVTTIQLSEKTKNADGKYDLLSGQTLVVPNASNIEDVNVDSAPVGSKISVKAYTLLTDVTIEVIDDVVGNTAILVSGKNAAGNEITSKVVSRDVDKIIAAYNDVLTAENIVAPITETKLLQTINTLLVTPINQDYNPSKNDGTYEAGVVVTMDKVQYMVLSNDKKTSVAGIMDVADVNVKTTNTEDIIFSTGFNRILLDAESTFQQKSSGTYTYSGATVVLDNDFVYSDEDSTMTVNFAESTGSYKADNFVVFEDDNDETTVSFDSIAISSNLKLNNTTGIISGDGAGTVITKKGGDNAVTTTIDISAIMTNDHSAIAGSIQIKADDNQKLEGGIFGFANDNLAIGK